MSDEQSAGGRPGGEVCWVSLADGAELVAARCDDVQSLVGADVVLLRDRHGRLRAGRFVGRIDDDLSTGEEPLEVVGVHSLSAVGESLDDVVDLVQHDVDSQVGIMGLPQGWRTKVAPRHQTEDETDFDIALRSAGYRRYLDNHRLKLAPGDTIMVAGTSVLVIAVDRRADKVEVQQVDGSETYQVTFADFDQEETQR